MISLSNRHDGRKGVGLVVGVEEREGWMEEDELEEGEAMEYDVPIDPDVDLSYIDKKLQDVLGHFQKDFEGMGCADTLGSAYGAYGSFLPTYRRSPSGLLQHKSPSRSLGHNVPRSLGDPHSEGACPSTAPLPGSSLSTKSKFNSTSRSFDDSGKKDACRTQSGAQASSPQHDASCNDQKTLKVRIKVGQECALARDRASIYSGLGLDTSPSTSSSDGQEFSPQVEGVMDESPSNLFQFYSCFRGERLTAYMMSPCCEYAMEKKMAIIKDCNVEQLKQPKNVTELRKSWKSLEKTSKPSNCKEEENDVSVLLQKESNIPSSKIVGEKKHKSLKEPGKGSCISKGSDEAIVRERTFSSDFVDNEHLNTPSQRSGSGTDTMHQKGKLGSKSCSAYKVSRDDKMIPANGDMSRKLGKVAKGNTSWSDDSINKDIEGLKGRKDTIAGPVESVKLKMPQKALSLEQDGETILPRTNKSSGSKKKSNGSQSNGFPPMEVIQGSGNAKQNVQSKEKKKGSHSKEQSECFSRSSHHHGVPRRIAHSERKTLDAKLPMSEQDNRREEIQQTISKNASEDHKLDYEDAALVAGKPKEKVGSKRFENRSTLKELEYESQAATLVGNSSSIAAVPQNPAPVMIEENWVACDKCQKWRLLPYGTEPKHLPKKWLCSMLNWLSGMNKCSISEEETTKAVHALYSLPASEGQLSMNVHTHNDVASSGITFADPHHILQTYDPTHQSVSSIAKKKLAVKEPSNPGNQLSFSQPTHPVKENSSDPIKSRNTNDGKKFHEDKISSQHTSKSTDFTMERKKKNLKEDKFLAGHSDEGDSTVQLEKKAKSKRQKDLAQDSPRVNKKMKSRDHFMDGKSGVDNDFSTKTLGKSIKSVKKDKFPSSMDHSHDNREGLSHGKKSKAPILSISDGQAETLSLPKTENFDHVKKRKMRDLAKSQVFDANHVTQEEVGDTMSKKVKKVEASKCEGRDLSSKKIDGKEEIHPSKFNLASNENGGNKGDGNLLQQNERDLDGRDFSKRDFYYSQHSTAATSSSSKVSGSRKSRTNFLEGRGSPVESVSSSPRNSNINKFCNRRDSKGKYDAENGGYSMWDSRRSSEGDMNGSYRCLGAKSKEKSVSDIDIKPLEKKRTLESGTLKSEAVKGGCNLQGREVAQLHIDKKEDLFERIFGGTDDEPSPSECEDINMGCDIAVTSEERNRSSNELQGKDRGHWKEQPKSCGTKVHGNQRKSLKSTSQQMIRQRNYTNDADKGVESQGNAAEKREPKNPPEKFVKKHSVDTKRENLSSTGIQTNVEANSAFAVEKHGGSSRIEQNVIDSGNVKSYRLQENVARALPREEENCQIALLDRLDEHGTLTVRGKLESSRCLEENIGDPQSQIESFPLKGNMGMSVEAANGDIMNAPKQSKKMDNGSRNPTPYRADKTPPLRKDGGQATAHAVIKEARDLKHASKRKKEEGLEYESAGLLFQSALKFLQVASLIEPPSSESAKHGDNTQWVQMYAETAKLCEFCAHEYEKLKELASAALAYKCMEVAYMKVVYFRHFAAVKDRHELQSAQIGESPSSSASDVDNFNNHVMLDKRTAGKGVNSTQVAENHIIAAHNHLNIRRILSFAGDVNSAMEASRKSLDAFSSSSICHSGRQNTEAVASVRRVLDFSFHDIVGLLRLIRLSLDIIGG